MINIAEHDESNIWKTHKQPHLNEGALDSFSLSTGSRQGRPFPPLLPNVVLGVLARVIKQEKEIKKMKIGKEEVKLTQFVEVIIILKGG